MNKSKTKINPDAARLAALLREARATPLLPPRFQQNVWRRIESAQAGDVCGGDLNWLDAVVGWLLRPRLALAVASVLVLTGVVLGWSKKANNWRGTTPGNVTLPSLRRIRCGEAMKRSLLIVLLALVAGVSVFLASYVLAQRLCAKHVAGPADDLDWLRLEFRLSAAEMARIRELHAGYLPKCAEMCAQIAAKKREVQATLAGKTNFTSAAGQKLTELGALRVRCQTQMLQHFVEVSHAMPLEPGRRYLAEMQRLTLGFHEQIEQSMSDSEGHAHGHH